MLTGAPLHAAAVVDDPAVVPLDAVLAGAADVEDDVDEDELPQAARASASKAAAPVITMPFLALRNMRPP
jgi:hypothetical protein